MKDLVCLTNRKGHDVLLDTSERFVKSVACCKPLRVNIPLLAIIFWKAALNCMMGCFPQNASNMKCCLLRQIIFVNGVDSCKITSY